MKDIGIICQKYFPKDISVRWTTVMKKWAVSFLTSNSGLKHIEIRTNHTLRGNAVLLRIFKDVLHISMEIVFRNKGILDRKLDGDSHLHK